MGDLEQCTAEQVVDAVEAVTLAAAACTPADVAGHVNLPQASVERALAVAEKLGLVNKTGSKYVAAAPYEHYFAEASESRRIDVLRFALEAFPPYRYFKQRLAFHGDPLRGARETKLRFGYENHEGEIRETLISLGQFAGSLTYSTEASYSVAGSGAVDEFLAVADAISTDRSTIEDYIRNRLGNVAYAYIQDERDDIVTHLRAALAKAVAEEFDESIVMEVANACENFLTKLADDQTPPTSLSGKYGVIQKAMALKDAGAIATKHMGYMNFLGHLRNAAEHGIDTEINAEWDVSTEGARLSVFMVLAAIKSVVALQHGRAEL
jgi:hypothetical protein